MKFTESIECMGQTYFQCQVESHSYRPVHVMCDVSSSRIMISVDDRQLVKIPSRKEFTDTYILYMT